MGETMWKVLLISYLFSCVTVNADKELLGDEISSDILQEIQKRLDIPPKCHSTRHSSTIIRTNESLSAGAEFLTSRNVGSERSCQKLCCQYTDCNVAIFEGDDEEGDGLDGGRQCYLFNCGSPNKCTFTHHRHYVSMSVKKLVNQHVTELKDLSKSVPDTEPGRDSEEIGEFPGDNEVEEEEAPPITTERTVMPSTTTTTVSTTMTTSLPATTPASTTVEPRVVAMLHHCRPQDKCDGEKTECIDGFCRCKTGYHPKNGVCRMNCNPHLEFECTNGDAKINGPDCIAVYDACDGIAQCADGSDEQFCDKSEGELATVDKSEEEHSQLNSARTGSGVGANEETQTVFRWEDRPGDGPSDSVKAGESLDGKASGTKSKVPPVKMPDKGQPQSNPTSEDGQEVNRPNLDHLEHKESTKSNIEVNPSKGSEENQVLTEVTSAGEPQPYSTIPAPTTSSEPFNTGNKDVDMTTAGITDVIMPSERSKLQPGKKATPSPNRPSVSSINNIGKEAKSSSTSVSKSEAQGAVIALSLGLSVTALLLLFVGCRYRNMKRKIRRGRPLNSNEADYLINGMYL